MGSSQSSELQQDTKIMQQSLVSSVSQVANAQSQSCNINQTVQVEVGPTGEITGGLVTSQTGQLTCNLAGQATTALTTDMINNMESQLETIAQQSSKSMQDFLATSINVQDQSTSIRNYISQTFQSEIKSITTNSCSQNLDITQSQKIIINGKVDSANLAQNAQGEAIASCIMSNVVQSLTKNDQFNSAVNKLDQTQSSEQKGLASLFNIWTLLIVIVIAAAVFAYFYFKSSGGSGAAGFVPPVNISLSSPTATPSTSSTPSTPTSTSSSSTLAQSVTALANSASKSLATKSKN